VVVLVDKDRVKSALHAIRHMGIDTLILDDGMQYLHLRHRLDVCLIDRQAPFGNEHLLPRGTLREPPGNLRRASYIFITKSDGSGNAALIQRIRRYNRTGGNHRVRPSIPLPARALHRCANPAGMVTAISTWERSAVLLSRQALKPGFATSAPALRSRADSPTITEFTERELQDFMAALHPTRPRLQSITTEKDSVRFPPKRETLEIPIPIYFLRVEIEILTGHESWQSLIDRICKPQPFSGLQQRYFRVKIVDCGCEAAHGRALLLAQIKSHSSVLVDC
jgi:tetraacyldisaccharide 4'-kinase